MMMVQTTVTACRFDSVYMDERIRCARDIRNDTLVVWVPFDHSAAPSAL